MIRLFTITLFMALPLMCCSGVRPISLDGSPADSNDWGETLSGHLRESKAYADLILSVVDARGLLETLELRTARLEYRAKKMGLSKAEAVEELSREREAHSVYISFLIAVETYDFKVNKLEDESLWRVRLISGDESQSLKPVEIVNLKTPNSETVALYPFMRTHDTIYAIRFSRAEYEASVLAAEKEIRLRIGGNSGRCDLIWELAGR